MRLSLASDLVPPPPGLTSACVSVFLCSLRERDSVLKRRRKPVDQRRNGFNRGYLSLPGLPIPLARITSTYYDQFVGGAGVVVSRAPSRSGRDSDTL